MADLDGDERELRILLVDNYDSYTYNLYHLIAETIAIPEVITNDGLNAGVDSYVANFDACIISPGPGTPHSPSDVGVCSYILKKFPNLPILGVCLGMQALAATSGAEVHEAIEPVHGRRCLVEHGEKDNGLFDGIPSGEEGDFWVVRYHSLVINPSTIDESSEIEVTAWSVPGSSAAGQPCDRSIMGVQHKSKPHAGVQFHPESVHTNYGSSLLSNFKLSFIDSNAGRRPAGFMTTPKANGGDKLAAPSGSGSKASLCNILWRRSSVGEEEAGGAQAIFHALCNPEMAESAFWLDSSSTDNAPARFSYMGGAAGKLWHKLDHDAARCICTVTDSHGNVHEEHMSVFDVIDNRMGALHLDRGDSEALPLPFRGGYVGYFGYGLKCECGGEKEEEEEGDEEPEMPDASLIFADRFVAVDHQLHEVFIVALTAEDREDGSQEWVDSLDKGLLRLKEEPRGKKRGSGRGAHGGGDREEDRVTVPPEKGRDATADAAGKEGLPEKEEGGGKKKLPDSKWRLKFDEDEYRAAVEKSRELIKKGETYEACLTNQVEAEMERSRSAFEIYTNLRAKCPAPYGAFLKVKRNVCVLSSSPERFLRISGDQIEAKPIKGTRPRGEPKGGERDAEVAKELERSVKDRAENLMIVDLLRNDLGKVCEVGSVSVPCLFAIESFSHVHQLVSTVRGRRRRDAHSGQVVRSCFPGGSMTGAPKLRTMRILGAIEKGPRGVYSGSIGFLSVDGDVDLSIAIRTAVVRGKRMSVGAGGAVVWLSDPQEEYEEMVCKADSVISAMGEV